MAPSKLTNMLVKGVSHWFPLVAPGGRSVPQDERRFMGKRQAEQGGLAKTLPTKSRYVFPQLCTGGSVDLQT
jgi:hypothetical protein